MRDRHHLRRPKRHERFDKPPLSLQSTTLWDYPSQHYGDEIQGDQKYTGATPSYVIWNVLKKYAPQNGLVIDPFCGSGTTLDVAKDLGLKARGFDIAPFRPDIEFGDARKLPLPKNSADVLFMDPPYSDHIHYSDHPQCLGKISAHDPRFFDEMDNVVKETHRVLKPGGTLAIFVCDFFQKKGGFAPVGFGLFNSLLNYFQPIDVIAVVRHNKSLKMGNYRKAAVEQNFYLRGFNYLMLGRKIEGN